MGSMCGDGGFALVVYWTLCNGGLGGGGRGWDGGGERRNVLGRGGGRRGGRVRESRSFRSE